MREHGNKEKQISPPLRGRRRGKGVARSSARGGINKARVSRSHAPAWECIHYADRFLFPCGSMGTRRNKSLPLEGEKARQGRQPAGAPEGGNRMMLIAIRQALQEFGMLVARLSGAMDGGGQSVHGRIYSGLATSMPNSRKNQYADFCQTFAPSPPVSAPEGLTPPTFPLGEGD